MKIYKEVYILWMQVRPLLVQHRRHVESLRFSSNKILDSSVEEDDGIIAMICATNIMTQYHVDFGIFKGSLRGEMIKKHLSM